LTLPRKLDRCYLEIRWFLQPGYGRLFGTLSGREVAQRAMRPVLIVIDSPRFNLLSRIV
jgi:hypothetical protein